MLKISVILPTLNAARTLERCLKSIRAQNWPEDSLEIVMADAGSTDDTLTIAKQYGVDTIVPNPLRTGEAGKSAAIKAATGDILALIDSDNLFDDTAYFEKAAEMFGDDAIAFVEPLGWTLDPDDTLVNRYSALIGMNDPFCYFLGNYNRYSWLSGKFTGMPHRIIDETDDAVIVEIHPCRVPTFGANGFMIRRSALEGLDWEPYYFDIDVVQQAARDGHRRIAIIKTETRHLYCDSIGQFRRKQARRIRDFHHHAKGNRRTYDYGGVPYWRYLWFIIWTVTIIPLFLQTTRGYIRKQNSAWWFHPLACWITLWEYGRGSIMAMFGAGEYDRSNWRQ